MSMDAISLLAGFLAGGASVWVIGRVKRAPAQNAADSVSYECACGQRYYTEQDAKEHARETHNAPMQEDEWRYIMTEVTA